MNFVSKYRVKFFHNHELRAQERESFILSDVDIILYIMYTNEARNMVHKMKASDFDTDGFYSPGGGEQLCLLGIPLDIPEGVTRSGVKEREEILVKTFARIGDCISCGERTTEDTIVFGTRYYRMLVLFCCDRVIWTTEAFITKHRKAHGWKGDSWMK